MHKILLPPLHIELGLMENFVKATDQTESVFKYLAEKFPRLSEAKIKRELLWVLRSASSKRYVQQPWDAFRLVSTSFLGNIRAVNYKELIENMLSLYHKLGCNMFLEIHMLHSHLDFFPSNCGMVSDEHCELFMRKL